MDIKKFDEAVSKTGGKFKTTSLIRTRLREMIQADLAKNSFSFEEMLDKIINETIDGNISIKESEN